MKTKRKFLDKRTRRIPDQRIVWLKSAPLLCMPSESKIYVNGPWASLFLRRADQTARAVIRGVKDRHTTANRISVGPSRYPSRGVIRKNNPAIGKIACSRINQPEYGSITNEAIKSSQNVG